MATKPSQFIWYELLTSDIDAATSFYSTVVGWNIADSGMPGMDYRILHAGDAVVGGMMTIPAPAAAMGMPPMWLGYVRVEDVDATIAGILAAGGSVRMPATDIPGVGRVATIADPFGAAIYIMKPAMEQGDSTAFAHRQPGHIGWNELHTSDWPAALSFYSAHFGWGKSSEMDMGPMGSYLLFNTDGGDAVGGMANIPGIARPYWLYYFVVEELDAAIARVQAAGGQVLVGPHPVPTGDWIVQCVDPQGAKFALVGQKTAG